MECSNIPITQPCCQCCHPLVSHGTFWHSHHTVMPHINKQWKILTFQSHRHESFISKSWTILTSPSHSHRWPMTTPSFPSHSIGLPIDSPWIFSAHWQSMNYQYPLAIHELSMWQVMNYQYPLTGHELSVPIDRPWIISTHWQSMNYPYPLTGHELSVISLTPSWNINEQAWKNN